MEMASLGLSPSQLYEADNSQIGFDLDALVKRNTLREAQKSSTIEALRMADAFTVLFLHAAFCRHVRGVLYIPLHVYTLN